MRRWLWALGGGLVGLWGVEAIETEWLVLLSAMGVALGASWWLAASQARQREACERDVAARWRETIAQLEREERR